MKPRLDFDLPENGGLPHDPSGVVLFWHADPTGSGLRLYSSHITSATPYHCAECDNACAVPCPQHDGSQCKPCACELEAYTHGRQRPLACSQCGRGNPTIRPKPKGGNMAAKKKKASKAKKPKAQNITEATAPGERIKIRVAIDDPEFVELKRREIADLSMEIQALEDEKRAKSATFSVKIKEKKELRKELFEEVETTTSIVEVEIVEIPNAKLGKMVYARKDTGEMVGERPMTGEERDKLAKQLDWEQQHQADEAAAKAEAKRKAANDADPDDEDDDDEPAEAAAQ